MKIKILPVMFDDEHVFNDKLDPENFGELWHLYYQYTALYQLLTDELPDIFTKASIFAFAYGAMLGEFSCDPSPYSYQTKNIKKFKDYLDRFYEGELTVLINQYINELSIYPEITLDSRT